MAISEGLGTIIGSGLGVVGSIAGGLLGGDAEKKAYQRRLQAYNEAIKRGQETQQAGENNLYNITDSSLPELQQLQDNLVNQENQALNSGAKQLQANLSQAGLRGGQLATQMARGIGNMTNDANNNLAQLKYDDANQRRNLKSAYEMAKAQAGTNAYLQQFQG